MSRGNDNTGSRMIPGLTSEFWEFGIRRIDIFLHGRPESADAIAQPLAQLGQSLGPEHQQRYSQNH
jgi:hypothetical protein